MTMSRDTSPAARLSCLSGFGVKGPAAFLLQAQGLKILLDFGCGPDPGVYPDVDRIGDVDAVVLSHGHGDHVGALSLLDRIGHPPVYATPWLLDALSVAVQGRPLPICGQGDVLGIPVRTGRTGHAPGGIWLHVAVGQGLLYTGDYYPDSLLYPFDPPPPAATVLFDASYGGDDDDVGAARRTLLDGVGRGPCLLPAPADGRGPEMAAFLQSEGVKVRVDEVTARAAQALLAGERAYLRPALADALQAVLREPYLTEDAAPGGAMIVAGGSGATGLAAQLLERWADVPTVQYVFTGYLPDGSRARALVDSGRAVSMRWPVHPGCAHNVALLREVGARQFIPEFTSLRKLGALAALPGVSLNGGPLDLLMPPVSKNGLS